MMPWRGKQFIVRTHDRSGPASHFTVVDERHGGEDDVPGGGNLMTAVVKLERALLFRLATRRFGAETAECLSVALARVADPELLAEAGEWLVRCDTGAELLARVAALADGGNGHGGAGVS